MGERPAVIDDDTLKALGAEILRIGRRRAGSYPGSVLDDSAFRVLWLLLDAGPRTLAELAADLRLEQSTVNRQVKAALERGLVERSTRPGAAGRLVAPTAAGEAAYQHDAALRGAVYRQALAALGEQRTARLVADLAAFNDAFDGAFDEAFDRASDAARLDA